MVSGVGWVRGRNKEQMTESKKNKLENAKKDKQE